MERKATKRLTISGLGYLNIKLFVFNLSGKRPWDLGFGVIKMKSETYLGQKEAYY